MTAPEIRVNPTDVEYVVAEELYHEEFDKAVRKRKAAIKRQRRYPDWLRWLLKV